MTEAIASKLSPALHPVQPVKQAANAAVPPPPPPVRKEPEAQRVNRATPPETPAQATVPPDTRLSVALDSETGTFVYRSISEVDGDVVWQWPSEQVMRVIQYFRRIESLEERIATKPKVDEKA
jgi:hypothetical protein